MNSRVFPWLIQIFSCCWLMGCGEVRQNRTSAPPTETLQIQSPSDTTTEPQPAPVPVQEINSDISVQIELNDLTDNPTIKFDQPFDVIITNQTDQPLRIWSPHRRNGWYQLSLKFVNLRSGITYTAHKRVIEHEDIWALIYDPDYDLIEIPAHENLSIQVDLSRPATELDGWTGLPAPFSSDRFSLIAQFEYQDKPGEDNPGIWGGKSLSEPVIAQLADPRIRTPTDFLRYGYTKQAIEMMEADPATINANNDNRTPLHCAASTGDLIAVRWLLDHGADVNAVPYGGTTPLFWTDSPDVVQLILQKKPDLTIICHGSTAFQNAAEMLRRSVGTYKETNKRNIVQQYIDAGTEVDVLTALYLDDIKKVKAILEKSPLLADEFRGQSPLRLAASLGRFEICRYLIDDHHVDINKFNRGGGYPIIKDALAYPNIVELFIAHGADLKTRITWPGMGTGIHIIGSNATALHFAAEVGVPETIRLLINNGVDIFSVADSLGDGDNRKNTALEVAAYYGAAENVAAIINHTRFADADPAVRQAELDHCLFIGAYSPFVQREPDRLKLARLLLEKGANPNTTENLDATEYEREITVLEAAVHAMDPDHKKKNSIIKEIVALLTSHGATMDLASAVAIGDTDEVRHLLKNNPELANARRSDGYPALHLAIELDHRPIVKALLDAGCNVDIRNQAVYIDNPGGTGLHCAVLWGRLESASMLIEAGADLNAQDARRSTPLHEAAEMGEIKMTQLLLKHGADSDAKNENGNTPFDLCRQTQAKRGKEKEKCVKEMEAVFREHLSRLGK